MAKAFILCFITALIFSSLSNAVVAGGNLDQQLVGWGAARSGCRGTIAECLADGDGEFDLDSEVSRRILATNKYISYGALSRNTVPCSRRGASYYNCRAGAQANPYSRGCSTITRCRS
ncbi:hypothetical protein RHSIM_Rhsim07G0187600 [Rhododendron simsii]|uniref:Rapid alkalinization factor n=1 Tax=Rhododendron simsii TaxID=118357 RepID=A0A834GMY5_RHOSS|nr:hypothetical protein RHSIM_Rhsim07G0187600 [Rhododendron simsii]